MTNVTNLNRFRKNRVREEKRKQAEENRIRHGRSKAEKQMIRSSKARAHEHIEGHKLDSSDE